MWMLEYNNVVRTLSEYGISDATYFWKNQMTDKFVFSIPSRAITEDFVFAAESTIKIFRNKVKWFEGVITQTPLFGSFLREDHKYEVSGSWWYLENLIYQQAWKEPIDTSDPESQLKNIFRGHVILGQDLSGEKIPIGEQITDIINYARSCGANINLGKIDIPVYIPFDECKDLSCADAIRRLLRWVPDTIYYIDYSTEVPTIFFKRRMQLTSQTINIFDGTTKDFSLQPRHDLRVPAVVLKFETTNNTNNKTWKTTSIQKYPLNATGAEFKTLVLTVNLEGSKSNYIIQKIVTNPVDTTSLIWWQKHIPWLNQFSSANITISDVSRSSTLPEELEDGVVADWMSKTVEEDIIRAKISYKNDDISVIDRDVAVKIKVTDATSRTYKKLMSLLTAETVPENLAQHIFEAVGILHYDGYITLVDREVDTNFSQFLLNFSNGRDEWKDMNAVVQEVVQHLDTGETYIKFGPSKHLGAADLTELTRSGRLLFESRNYADRVSAEASGNGLIDQGIHCKVENTSSGDGKYNMLKFVDPENSKSVIKIDVRDLTKSLSVILREEDVCDAGILKKRFSLASEPFIES